MFYAIYEQSSGEIRSVGYSPDGDEPAEGALVGNSGLFTLHCATEPVNFSDCLVSNGVIVSKTQAAIDAQNLQAAWNELKQIRTSRLSRCDWTQAQDTPLTEAKRLEWSVYRQALRDLPANTVDPANPTWPTEPT